MRTIARNGHLVSGLLAALVFSGGAMAQGGAGPEEAATGGHGPRFQRVATFPVFLNTDVDAETVAEIVTSARGGTLLIYTDSATAKLGFVDITDPANPVADGVVALAGEPTSVGVVGDFALAVVNTSIDFVNTSGLLQIIDLDTRQIVRSIELGGQPDAIAVSPDARYAAIAIENERDEDLGDGEPPQLPAGYVVVADLVGGPQDWSLRRVGLVGVPDLFPEDPEPEFVDISEDNIAVVTLQENNHIVLIDLSTGRIVNDFPAGSVDLRKIDTEENDLIEQTASLENVAREPDAAAWVSRLAFATADEGDLFGGSRGFTIFGAWGGRRPLQEAGASVEHAVARIGHYPEGRSENKGSEPEGVEYGRYGDEEYLFVGAERANVVLVYRLVGPKRNPKLVQMLPTGVGPEGLHAIPERGLFVVASEADSRGDKFRASVMIYQLGRGSEYPDIRSGNRRGGVPIPWAALSGLASDPSDDRTVYAIHDSFYRKSRIYTVQVHKDPAVIRAELPLNDSDGVLLQALTRLKAALPGTDDFVPESFINDDGTVNLDLEGIEALPGGRFIVASEGSGNLVDGVSDPDDRPFESPNLIALVGADGTIEQVAIPTVELTRNQFRFGLEGVASSGGYVYVAFQRAWRAAGDPADRARIGRYDPASGQWTFAYYPLDEATSPNGGWVGLSEITALADGRLAILERDDQGGTDARVKRVYAFSVGGVEFRPNGETPNFDVVEKVLVRDLLAQGDLPTAGGFIPEKLEGLTVVGGEILVVNDNDGVDDNSGETRLLRIAR